MNKTKLMAMIGIILVISMPIYSSVVMASFLQVTSAHGNDNIEGYLKDSDDTLTVGVEAYVDDDEDVTVDQVRYGGCGDSPMDPSCPGVQFDECLFVDPNYECTFTYSSLSGFSNPKKLYFYLYDDEDLKAAYDSYEVYFDELDPVINSFDITPDLISSGDVDFSFDIEEAACNYASCVNRCSGIDKIELSAGSYTDTIDVNSEPNDCSYVDSISVPLLTIEPEASGEITETITATITVYDNMGMSNSASESFSIDTALPEITISDDAAGSWVSSDDIVASVTDDGGVDSLEYKFLSSSDDCNAESMEDDTTDYSSGSTITVDEDNNEYICFKAVDDAANENYLSSGQLQVDSTNPTIELTDDVEDGWVASDDVTVDANFSISDKATFDYLFIADGDSCGEDAGWDGTDIDDDATINIDYESENDNDICFRLVDNAGNTVYQATSYVIQVDTSLPEIENLQVLVDGESLDYVSDSTLTADVIVEVNENVDITDVRADLSELHKDASDDYYNMQATCTGPDDDNLYSCSWSSVEVSLNQTTTVSINVNASDTVGNNVTVTLTKDIEYDATGPEVTSITTNWYDGAGNYYMGHDNNQITVALTEEGVGLNNTRQIYLDLSGINPSLTNVQTDNCTEGWTCYFYDVEVDSSQEGTQLIYVNSDSSDDLGNTVTGVNNLTVTLDVTSPQDLGEYSITNLAADAYEDVIKTGDSLYVEINVSETNQLVNVYANYSSIVDGADSVLADSCTNITDKWTCSWTTTPIDVSGEIDDMLKFYFIDAANNTLPMEIPIYVFGVNETAEVNLWKSSVECSPDRFDRELTSLTQMRSFCHVYLQKQDSLSEDQEPETLSIVEGTCVDNDNTSSSAAFISALELMNDEQGSTEPYIKLTLAQSEATLDKIDVNCSLQIVSKLGETIFSQPEIENVTVELLFYNNPLGEIAENIEDDIKEVEDDIGGAWEIIGMLNTLMSYAEMGCKIWYIWNNLAVVWQGLHLVLGNTEEALTWFPPGQSQVRAARITSCTESELAREAANKGYGEGGIAKLCNFVNCKVAADFKDGGGWAAKFGGAGGIFGKDSLNKWAGATGGGIEYNTDNTISGTSDGLAKWTAKDPRDYMDVKNSLVLSVVTLCIPGIIYNLDKWRQVQCIYGACLLSIKDTSSVPISVCQDQKDYLECKYIYGEIFKIIPFTALLNYYINIVKNIFSDPFSVIGTFAALSCVPECNEQGNYAWPYHYCVYLKLAATLGEAIRDFYEMSDNDWKIEEDYCEVFREMMDEFDYESEEEGYGGLFG